MKVLYVVSRFPQNSESYVDYEIAYVTRQGINVEVWAPMAGYGDPATVKVHRGELRNAIAAVRPDIVHVHHMTTAEYYMHSLPARRTTVRAHSFDWSVQRVAYLSGCPPVAAIFGFPHLARQASFVIPLPVAYNEELVTRRLDKDRRQVVRLGACLPTKRLTDFIEVGNRMQGEADFTLGMCLGIGQEEYVDKLVKCNRESGGHVRILVNMPHAEAIALTRTAGIYMATSDERAHEFGMPISIAEAQGSGSIVLARSSGAGAAEYIGKGKFLYSSVAEAVYLIQGILRMPNEAWEAESNDAYANSARFRSAVVLPRLIEEWNKIYAKVGGF